MIESPKVGMRVCDMETDRLGVIELDNIDGHTIGVRWDSGFFGAVFPHEISTPKDKANALRAEAQRLLDAADKLEQEGAT